MKSKPGQESREEGEKEEKGIKGIKGGERGGSRPGEAIEEELLKGWEWVKMADPLTWLNCNYLVRRLRHSGLKSDHLIGENGSFREEAFKVGN